MAQLDLFDAQEAVRIAGQAAQPDVIDFKSIAAAGERRNATYDPNARTSAAQEDLGGRIRVAANLGNLATEEVLSEPTKVPQTKKPYSRSNLSSDGKAAADREPDAHDPTYQAYVPLTAEERAAGLRGLDVVKQITTPAAAIPAQRADIGSRAKGK